jgi:nucleotide-binding universal stress UspA family protein
MNTRGIVAPTDFSETAQKAVEQAIMLAKISSENLTLVHIEVEGSPADTGQKLEQKCEEITRTNGVKAGYVIQKEQDLTEDISRIIEKLTPRYTVIGTHGVKGIAQHLFGARILNVIRPLTMPSLVLQSASTAKESFKKILLPVDDIDGFDVKVRDTAEFARLFDSEILLYAISHPMVNSAKVVEHINLSRNVLNDAGIRFTEIEEEPTVFSAGMAKQTLKFAEMQGVDLIVISLAETVNKGQMNKADCERVLNNEQHIAVLCTPGRSKSGGLFK